MLPAANWVLELLDARETLEAVTDTTVTMEDTTSFQERVAKPFVSDLKSNISNLNKLLLFYRPTVARSVAKIRARKNNRLTRPWWKNGVQS